MLKFHAIVKNAKGVTTSLTIEERDYATLWLKLDGLGLTVVEIKTLTT